MDITTIMNYIIIGYAVNIISFLILFVLAFALVLIQINKNPVLFMELKKERESHSVLYIFIPYYKLFYLIFFIINIYSTKNIIETFEKTDKETDIFNIKRKL